MTAAPATPVHPDCVAAAESAGRLLESLGHNVEPSFPAALNEVELTTNFITLWSAGNAWSMDYWSRKTGRPLSADEFEPLSWALAEMGRSYTAPQYLAAVEWLQAFTRRV